MADTLNLTSTNLHAGSPAKSIFVYRNGDTNFQCKRIVVNPRQIKNWDSFIELLTTRVKAKNGGAVRRVLTPQGRTKVTELTDIENNHFYVAAGAEGFQRHEYNKISGQPISQRARLKLPPIIKPVEHSRLKVSARCRKYASTHGTKVIYVFRNGDIKFPAVKVLFRKFMLKDYEVVLKTVTEKVNLIQGAVHKLFTLEGKKVSGSEDFEEREFYVACGKEQFIKCPYPKDGVIVSPRVTRPPNVFKRRPRPSKDSSPPKPSQNKQEQKESKPAKKTTPSKPSQTRKPKAEKTREQKEAEEVFHSKPTMVKRSREKEDRNSLDFSDDPEGVFKAKEERDETKDAAEVQETNQTVIDLPIDQVTAEEIEEEEIKEDLEAELPREATPTQQPPELEPVNLVDRMIEDNEESDEPSGHYSKRSPVTSKQSPIISATNSPTISNGRGQTPNDNNNNSKEIRESPLQNGRENEEKENSIPPSPTKSPEVKENSAPASPARSSPGFFEQLKDNILGSDDEDDDKNKSGDNKDENKDENKDNNSNRVTPVKEKSAPPSPAKSNRSSPGLFEQIKDKIFSSDDENDDKEKEKDDEPALRPSTFSPHPPTENRSATYTPNAASIRRTQTPKDNRNSSAKSRDRNSSAKSRDAQSRGREVSSRDAPSSGNPLVDNSANQAAEAGHDENSNLPKKEIENDNVPGVQEGEVAA